MIIPRPEHPNPQFMRKDFVCLNGEWEFEFDFGKSGTERRLYARDAAAFSKKITVPFCVESELSGIGYKDFMTAVWYRREFEIPEDKAGGKIFLHFGAVDYDATIYINGFEAGSHKGGYVSFKIDITNLAHAGTNIVTLYVEDDTRSPHLPTGKQCAAFYSRGCEYTRTTGIWQTVWLEFAPLSYIEKVRFYPDYMNARLNLEVALCGKGAFMAEAFYEGKSVGKATANADGGYLSLNLQLTETHLWEIGNGRLYDLVLAFNDDVVESYFGLRNVCFDGMKFRLNGKSVFQRLVLDQGFYPDGIYTAPTDEALLGDIKLSKAAGFNGARLHEKIFEPRFLYHADKEGYIVWGEYPNWGIDHTRPEMLYSVLPEWMEEINRDFNHPSIIGWGPFNETWDINNRRQHDEILRMIYRVTKSSDTTRPCIDTSGNYHVETDVFDLHDYDQNPETFKARYDELMTDNDLINTFPDRQQWEGQPVFISEYGGIKWSLSEEQNAWGYGNAPKTEEEYINRYRDLTNALLDNDQMFAFCYTQLTDVEQEQNGIYTYDRKVKVDPAIFKEINTRKAAIED